MKSAAVAIVLLGIALVTGLALATGLDTTGMVILVSILGMGALAIAVARKSTTGAVRPTECPSCGGLVSPNAPYCKHCGTELQT